MCLQTNLLINLSLVLTSVKPFFRWPCLKRCLMSPILAFLATFFRPWEFQLKANEAWRFYCLDTVLMRVDCIPSIEMVYWESIWNLGRNIEIMHWDLTELWANAFWASKLCTETLLSSGPVPSEHRNYALRPYWALGQCLLSIEIMHWDLTELWANAFSEEVVSNGSYILLNVALAFSVNVWG